MLNFIKNRNTPRWIVYLNDLIISICAFTIAYFVRFDFNIPTTEVDKIGYAFLVFILIKMIVFFLGRTYSGIIRHTSSQDLKRLATVLLLSSAAMVLTNWFMHLFLNQPYLFPRSVIIIEFFVSIVLLYAIRILIKSVFQQMLSFGSKSLNVLIYGAGQAGIIAKRTIDSDPKNPYKVSGFIDISSQKIGKRIESIKIYGPESFEHLVSQYSPKALIFSVQQPNDEARQKIVSKAFDANIKVLNVPPPAQWINGQLSVKQLRAFKIEDLLGRPAIETNKEQLLNFFKGKRVLITGAAGSIGSEIVKQVLAYSPKTTILFDQAESPLYELEQELIYKKTKNNFEVVIGDVSSRARMKKVFDSFKPQIVFHAAAYKHVPLMELNPAEAIRVNIKGTKVLTQLATEYKVETFVMISTDKAVNPTNVMGGSKRIAELIVKNHQKEGNTKFITTRFGNVLGSNGSVIPLFKKQIEKGGPITVTHPEITRYFMTIPEAVSLVLDAGVMGTGGEVFVFDMGESVKIVDLAKKMIKLSGMELDKDITIAYTGLRPGEKLYEELLSDSETTQPTHHPKILIGKDTQIAENFSENIDELILSIDSQNNELMVSKMKELVPEYISKNSGFEKLDSQNRKNL